MLGPYKAQVLLRLLLAAGADSDELTAALTRHGRVAVVGPPLDFCG
ncbi:Protein of unknown function [Micromonospora lupini str. Lupac 08]|uniref:Uncharacterized protein n=1 Tax=Micromonospora lupini str. Lupac 08 TaxID=1150864 RepID=I0KYV1_9ACTN|nr:Protein of unknown function [Micromonospora lupini str. Lupac 08]